MLFVLLLAVVQGQARGAEWQRAAWWDGRYATNWAPQDVTIAIRDGLQAAGYTILDSDQLKTWMNARIADKKLSVVVLCRDVAPDTVIESMSAACTLRKYLDAGGKIVFYADIPFYNQAHSDGTWTNWADAGAPAILGFNTSSAARDSYTQVTITAAGMRWGLTQTWASQRPAAAGITDNFEILATDAAGNAAAWVKHYVTGDTYRGFIRIWDIPCTTTYRPSIEDIIRLAEYKGYFKAYDPIPGNGRADVLTPLLQWTPGDTAAFHDVYFGTNPAPGPAEFIIRQGWPMYWHGPGITPEVTYYWRIDEVEADGVTIHTGDVWSFTAAPSNAFNPNPANGAKWIDVEADLSWSAGATGVKRDVYFGTDQTAVANGTGGTLKASQQTKTTYDPGTLAKGTTYYWRIDEYNSGGTKYPGDVWSFKTMPDIPISDPDLLCWWKLDEGEGTTVIDWSGHNNHGRFVGDPQWVVGYDGGAVDLDGGDDYLDFGSIAGLPAGTAARSMCGWGKTNNIAAGWRWIAAYGSPNTSQAMFIGLNGADLYGGGYGDDVLEAGFWEIGVWHHICLTYDGTTARLYADGIQVDSAAKTWNLVLSRVHIGRQVNTAVEFWNGLVDDVRIYKKALTPEDIKQVMRGDTTLAWNPKPANKSITDVERAVPLTWSPGDKAAQHDVYFGTDQTAVEDATTASTGIYQGRQAAASYAPPGGLQWGGGPYYWRIDEYNTDGTVSTGRLWSFTVADYLIVDDFEDYTDDVGSRIFQAWKDGWGYSEPSPGYPGNGTGSTVGYGQAPFAEQSTVHSGGQSMPLGYDNSGAGGKTRYSETFREWAAPMDWTKHSLKALTLYFYGDPNNAAEQLYVALEDNAAHIKVVNHPHLEAVQKAGWQEWNIELTQFSAAGVNLKAVKRVYIGLGNRTSPKAGGTGTIYIDDIRVYRSRCVPSMSKPAADIAEPYDCKVDYKDLHILADEWLFQAQLQDWQERAAYWDGRYPFTWGGDGVAMRDGLAAAGYTILNADQLKTWMNARIADKKLSVVVFCQDVVPDTVCETMSDTCTLRRYLDAGGKIVWYADWPFYYQGHTDGTSTTWGSAGASTILGFNASSGPNDSYDVVVFTSAGTTWGLTTTWQSQRPTSPTITSNVTPLATTSAGSAAAWAKHFVPRNKARGFVRIWDTTGTPPVADVISVAESKGALAADLRQDNVINFKDFAVLADSWLEAILWP